MVTDIIETIKREGIVAGADWIFIETHFDSSKAKSDGTNILDLKYLENLITRLVAIRKTINSF